VQQQAKVVAVLAANPALTSILGAVLRAHRSLRVRQFESLLALQTYMRLAAVDLVVCDFDGDEPANVVARTLRFDSSLRQREFQVIALASTITTNTKQASLACGITEVIVKPMSPKYLMERVLSRLRSGPPEGTYTGPERRRGAVGELPPLVSYAGRGDNVVQLFPR